MLLACKFIILGFLISIVGAAQTSAQSQRLGRDVETLLRDPRWREFLNQQADREAALLQRQDEQQSERKVIETMHTFVLLWNQFANEYNQKKVLNVKLAKEVSKAFRKVENATGWRNAIRRH